MVYTGSGPFGKAGGAHTIAIAEEFKPSTNGFSIPSGTVK
jgi:hypothetical protein